jgi:outer membrane protein TolC
MRVFVLTALAASAALAADNSPATTTPMSSTPAAASTLVTSTHTPTADSPVFGTPTYFKKIWNTPSPKLELRTPIRIGEFVREDKLELSLRDYLDAVLANNTEIQIQRLSIEQPRNAILRGHRIYDPLVTASFNSTRRETPSNDALAGANILNQLNQPFQFRWQQMLQTGTTMDVNFNTSKASTNNAFALFNPAINSGFNGLITQPLLRNRGGMINRLPITIARSRLRGSEYNIQDQVLRLVATAENAYWEVISARENLRVQEQALALSDQTLKRAQKEFELGAISQLEIFQPQAQYANSEILVTQARFRLQQAEDALRRQMGADLDPKLRNLPIVLTETVAAPVQPVIDRDELIEKALRQRPDLRASRQNLDVADLTIQFSKNALRPDLRLTGQYGSSGRGGTFYQRQNIFGDDGTRNTIVSVVPGGMGDALNQLFAFNYPVYGFGVALQLPIRDRAASADYADAVVNKRLELLRIRNAEQNARLEVLNAITQVENSKASVELAKIALDLAQKRVDADQQRFDLGTITLFFLLDAQTNLTQAQSALVNQTVNYRRNLTNLHRATGDLLGERGIAVE